MFSKLKYRISILKKLNNYAFGVRKFFVFLVYINSIGLASSLIVPFFYRIFVDQVIIDRQIEAFVYVVVGYLSLFSLNTLLAILRSYSNNRLVNRVMFRIKYKLMCNYLNISFQEYEKRNTGDLKMRIDDDASKLGDFANKQSVDYLRAVITSIVAAILILSIEWQLALFSIIVIPLTFYLDHIISLKEKELQDINRGNDQNWNSWLYSSIQGWKEVRALNLQKHQIRTFVKYAHNYAEFMGRWINYWVLRVLIIPKIKDEFLMKFALYFFGGILIIRGDITIGSLLVFAIYYDLLSENIRLVSSTDAELQSNMSFYDRVMSEMNTTKGAAPKLAKIEQASGDISMKNISFSYHESLSPVLSNFNLHIEKGDRVAIIGKSGSGKSTILKLMTGLLTPNGGEVMYSGKNIAEINQSFLYKNIGIVLQDNLLFNVSIGENLRLACPDADIEMMDNACRKACIYDFIYAQPNRYNTLVGEKGVKLSGGQRQRLVLARLFLRDVDILIFDEATSSIDQYSENIIHDAIKAVSKEKTIIVVAHRESSIALCDRVISL